MTTTPTGRARRVNKIQFCELAGITRQQFDALVRDGLPLVSRPDSRGGDYALDTGTAIAWLATKDSGDNGEVLDLNEEKARLAKEQADKASMENARLRGAMVPASDVLEGWQSAISRTRALLLRLPYALAPELVRIAPGGVLPVAQALTKALNNALIEMTDTRVDDDTESDDAGDAGDSDEDVGAAARYDAERVGGDRVQIINGRKRRSGSL